MMLSSEGDSESVGATLGLEDVDEADLDEVARWTAPSEEEKIARESRRRVRYAETDDLEELEKSLRNAYIVKVLQAQIIERQADRMFERIQERNAGRAADLVEAKEAEEERRRKEKVTERAKEYRRLLEEQISLKEAARRAREVEETRERVVLEEVDRIRGEDEEARRRLTRVEEREKLTKESIIFQEVKAIRRAKEEEREAEEEELRRRHREKVEERREELRRLTEEQRSRRAALIEEVARRVVDVDSLRVERREALMELVAEEAKCEAMMLEREEELKRWWRTVKWVEGLDEQIALNEKRRWRVKIEERRFARDVMDRILLDERIARLTSEARKRQALRYRDELDRIVEERRSRREEEMKRIREAWEEERQIELATREDVRRKREALLMEHARNVGEFMRRPDITAEEEEKMTEVLGEY